MMRTLTNLFYPVKNIPPHQKQIAFGEGVCPVTFESAAFGAEALRRKESRCVQSYCSAAVPSFDWSCTRGGIFDEK